MPGWVGDIEQETLTNETFRTVVFTGEHTQLTVMSIEPGDDIGGEVHTGHDQFLRIEGGTAVVQMGPARDDLGFERSVSHDDAVFVPAGSWHNLTNTGDVPLKLYSVYAPPQHPHGTVHLTKAEADAAEHA